MPKVKVGDVAPDFELPCSDGSTVRLSSMRGSVVVLNFYPGDGTATCTKQMCSYTERWDDLAGTGARVFGISKKGLDSKARFIAKNDLRVPLLADEDGAVARLYGLVVAPGFTKRATFIVDAAGVVAWAKISISTMSFAKPDELIEQVRATATR